jgi:hypothetical protein
MATHFIFCFTFTVCQRDVYLQPHEASYHGGLAYCKDGESQQKLDVLGSNRRNSGLIGEF